MYTKIQLVDIFNAITIPCYKITKICNIDDNLIVMTVPVLFW